jgi:beta-glucosidase
VLLANDGILPLDAGKLRRLAVLGPQAPMPPGQGGGSSNLRPDYAITPLDGLRAALPGVEILINPADAIRPGWQLVAKNEVLLPAEAGTKAGQPGILVRILDEVGARGPSSPTASLDGDIGRELRRDIRPDGRLMWGGDPILAGQSVLEISTRIVSKVSGRHRIAVKARGRTAVWIDGKLIVEEGEPLEVFEMDDLWGNQPYHVAEVELQAGRPIDFRARWRKFYDQNHVTIDLSIEKPTVTAAEALTESERLARSADAVVLVIGTSDQDETEGRDRESLSLQPAADELVRRVAAANPRTIVVVSAGSPVEMPWRDDVAAILLTWFPGQEAGNALADMLLGRVEPGGRLPTTWPAEMADVPVLDTQPIDGTLVYTEGLHVGYKAWLQNEIAPAFPFGHGGGYTTWTYLDVEPAAAAGEAGGTPGSAGSASSTVAGPAVTVRLRNSGSRPGREVVQLYLARPDSAVERPLLWLGGFASVEAAAGQTVEVVVPVDPWALRHWDDAVADWAVEPGRFEVRVGRSVGDLRLATIIGVEA